MSDPIMLSKREDVLNVMDELLKHFSDPKAKMVKITIKKVQGKHTLQQLRYYWSQVVGSIKRALHELGNDSTSEEVSYFLKKMFYSKTMVLPDGSITDVPQSIAFKSETDIQAMSALIDASVKWAGSNGIYVPPSPIKTEMRG